MRVVVRTVVLRTMQLWLVGLVVCLAESMQSTAADCDPVSEFFNDTAGLCKPCTNCSSRLQRTVTECTDTNDTVCSYCPDGHFYNTTSDECDPCSSECPVFGQRPISQCNRTHDLYCEPCKSSHLIYNAHAKDCTLNCSLCPKKKCAKDDFSRCECGPCRIGLLCEIVDPDCESGEVEPSPSATSETRAPVGGSESLSSLTSALIGIGVVLGIVVFSVVFVIIGLSTSCRSKDSHNSSSSGDSEKSVDKLSMSGTTSASLVSLYTNNNGSPTFLDYRASLEILKQSGGHGSRSSPKLSSGSVPIAYYSAYKNRYKDSLLTPV